MTVRKNRNKFVAQYTLDGETLYLGSYRTIKEAKRVVENYKRKRKAIVNNMSINTKR